MPADPDLDADDRRLMAGIAAGDVASFQAFYRRYSPTVFAVARRILGQEQEAEDVLADVFWELWEKSARYNPSKGSPHSYLIMLTRCRALDRKRGLSARGQHFVLEWSVDGQPTSAVDRTLPYDPCLTAENRQLVQGAIEKLDPQQRQAIEAVFFDGLTHRETAEKFGVPLGTLKARVRAALGRLKNALQIHQR
jgi:RNA polymerase sigma-70 factor (ECF subfamily)